jgi:hypothetical protein
LEDHQFPSTFIGSCDKEYRLIKGKRQGKDSLHLIGQGKEAPLGGFSCVELILSHSLVLSQSWLMVRDTLLKKKIKLKMVKLLMWREKNA